MLTDAWGLDRKMGKLGGKRGLYVPSQQFRLPFAPQFILIIIVYLRALAAVILRCVKTERLR